MRIRKPDFRKVRERLPFTMPIFRILLALIIPFAILSGQFNIAFAVFLVTAIIGFFDVLKKRSLKIQSQLWSILDPFADKLLINATAITLYLKGYLPLWIVGVFFAKDILMVVAGLVILIKNRFTIFKQNLFDKIATFMQVIALLLTIKGNVDIILLYSAVVLTILSALFAAMKSNYRLARRTDIDEFKFKNLIKLADIVTLLNVVSGLASAYFAINNKFGPAAAMLIVAVAFDTLDGKVARLTHRTGDFGKELDSLADTVSFGVAPAIFGYSLIQTNIAAIAFAVFLFAGILRLARYNIMNLSGEYAGMPITLNGLLIPLIYFIKVPVNYYPYLYIFLAILMVSSIRVKKVF